MNASEPPKASERSNVASVTECVLTAIARLQDATAGTEYEPVVDELVDALAGDTTAADLRQEIEFVRAERLRLAQGLRVIRDTTSATSVYGQLAARALVEAGVPDPPEEDHS